MLVVDDTESKRYVLSTWLRRAGYDVLEAQTGNEALALTATEPLDIVVLDVNLPDVSGYDVCERIKAAPRTSDLPVLHVSAFATSSVERSQGLRRGADSYLAEPIDRDELVATVEALLRGAAAQRTAVRLARQLRRLHDATLAINRARTLDELVAIVVSEASALFESTATLAVAVDERCILASQAHGAAVTVAPCTPEIIESLRRRDHERSTDLAITLDDHGQRGIFTVVRPTRADDEAEILFSQYARAAGTAITNLRSYDVERRIALMLQRSLLPDGVPDVPGLDVAIRYDASAGEAEVGGDFYEIFLLDAHLVAIAIGDVVGHSLEAAAVMAQLRTGFRSYMLEGHGPSGTLDRLNRLLCRFHPGITATVWCAVYDRRDGSMDLANAGHLPPLVLGADRAAYMPLGGTLLGIASPAIRTQRLVLAPGEVMVLFTDGLVERRGEPIDAGLDRLAAVATARPIEDLNALCDRLLREAGPEVILDDIAVVALRRVAVPEP